MLQHQLPIHGSGKVISYVHPLLYLQTNTDAQRTAKITATETSGTYINQKVIKVEMLRTLLGTPTTNADWDLILKSVSPNGYVYGDITNSGGFTTADAVVMEHYIGGTISRTNYCTSQSYRNAPIARSGNIQAVQSNAC